MSQLEQYRRRMTRDDVRPAGNDPAEIAAQFIYVRDDAALVLRWASNDQCPLDDMLAAWLVLGIISEEQAAATSQQRAVETAEFLAKYRQNARPPAADELSELRAAFGPDETVVDIITGRRTRL